MLPDGRGYKILSGSFENLVVIPQSLREFLETKSAKIPALSRAVPPVEHGNGDGDSGGGDQRHRDYALAAIAAESLRVGSALVGTRNDTLNLAVFSIATMVESYGINLSDLQSLRDAGRNVGLSDLEIDATFRAAFAAGLRVPRPPLSQTAAGNPPLAINTATSFASQAEPNTSYVAVTENWPVPDPTLLNGGIRPAAPFPIDVLGVLGSGLIVHSQKMTAAAMQIADMKVWAHRS